MPQRPLRPPPRRPTLPPRPGIPKPVANGTLNSIAEIGAAPVTAMKITPIKPMAPGLRRSTPESESRTDSTMPS